MESKITLYDAHDKRVGETFPRRAKQLVKQQRAVWLDESQTAIRFSPDVDEWDAAEFDTPAFDAKSRDALKKHDAWLVEMAERRIWERKMFIVHSILVLPAWFFLAVSFAAMTNSMYMPMFISGACFAAYGIHAYHFFTKVRKKRISQNREERRAKILAAEVEMLRAELQRHA